MLYQVFKHRSIPMFVERDYDTEDKNDLIKLEEAFEKIKAAIEKNNFKTTTDYDKIVSIHYSILIFVENYINLLQKFIEKENYKKEEYLKKLEDLLKCFYTNFDLNNEDEYIFFKGLQTIFYESNKLDEGIDYFTKRLNNCHENVKLDVYMYLFDLIMCRYDDIHRLDEFIEAEKDKELKEILVKEKLTLLNIKNGYEE